MRPFSLRRRRYTGYINMKKIYFYALLAGFVMAPTVFFVGYNFNIGDFIFGVEQVIFNATEHTTTVELDFITLALLLTAVSFL